jgi:glycopeptide antibiotics resistance protein
MAANVVMFLPFGILVPMLWPSTRATARVLWLGLGASLAIELTQLLFLVTLNSRRTVDINDLIANAGGAVLGYWLLQLIRWSNRAELSRPSR